MPCGNYFVLSTVELPQTWQVRHGDMRVLLSNVLDLLQVPPPGPLHYFNDSLFSFFKYKKSRYFVTFMAEFTSCSFTALCNSFIMEIWLRQFICGAGRVRGEVNRYPGSRLRKLHLRINISTRVSEASLLLQKKLTLFEATVTSYHTHFHLACHNG